MSDLFAVLDGAGFAPSKQPTENNMSSVDLVVHIPLTDNATGGSERRGASTTSTQISEDVKEDFRSEVISRASSTITDLRRPGETEVERFKREREERIRGSKLSQTIKEEEEARKRADEEAARLYAKEQAKRQAEEESRRSSQQIKEEEDRREAMHIQQEGGGQYNGDRIITPTNSNLKSQSIMTSYPEVNGVKQNLENPFPTMTETTSAQINIENGVNSTDADAENSGRPKKHGDETVTQIAAHEAEAAEALRLAKEEQIAASRAEAARIREAAMTHKMKKAMEDRIAAQTKAARLQKEREDEVASLASENRSYNSRRPLSAKLKKFRERHEKREDELRGIMQGISVSASGESEKSLDLDISWADTESLVSHNRNLARGVSLKWEKLYLPFCFGLLTTRDEAPRTGPYQPHESIEVASLLQKIMKKINSTAKEVLEESTGNVIMKSQDPFVTAVKIDGEYLFCMN